MTGHVHIVVEGRPVGKARPRAFMQAGRIVVTTPTKTREHAEAIAWRAKEAMKGEAPWTGAVRVNVLAEFVPPKSWTKAQREDALTGTRCHIIKPDADNLAKQALDGLRGIVFADDCQVVKLDTEKRYGLEERLVITAWQTEMVF